MKNLQVRNKPVVIYNNYTKPAVNENLRDLARAFVSKGIAVIFQNINGYKPSERVTNARAVILVEEIGGKDLHKRIQQEYKAIDIPVHVFKKDRSKVIAEIAGAQDENTDAEGITITELKKQVEGYQTQIGKLQADNSKLVKEIAELKKKTG